MPGVAYTAAVTVATWFVPSNSFTVVLASAVPTKINVVLVVTLSLLEQPESLAAVRSGVEGAAGGVLSSVFVTALPLKLLPALSVAVACTVYVPSFSNDQSGNATPLVQMRDVLPVVPACSVGSGPTRACHAHPS